SWHSATSAIVFTLAHKFHVKAPASPDHLLTKSRWGGWLLLPASECQSVELSSNHEPKEPSAMEITTVGLDQAKKVFQVHGINSAGEVSVRKTLRRSQV